MTGGKAVFLSHRAVLRLIAKLASQPPDNIFVFEAVDDGENPDQSSNRNDLNWGLEFFRALPHFALIAVTCGLVYFTWKQWKISRHQYRLNRQIFYAEHRPRLRVRDFDAPRLGEVNRKTPMNILEELFQKEFSASFNIVNIGGTAARIIKDYFTLQIRHFEFDRIPWKITTTETRAEIPVGGSHKIRSPRWKFTKDEFTYMMDKTLAICLIGEVHYQDKIGNERTTTFYRRFNFDAKRFDPVQIRDYENED